MPWSTNLFSQLAHLSGRPAFLGLIVTAAVVAVVRDWRLELWALLVQYVLVGVLHMRMLPPELALVKVLVGALICPMLYWAARWVEGERAHRAEVERERAAEREGEVPLPPPPWPICPTNWAFRSLVVLFLGLVLYGMFSNLKLPFIASDIAPACVWLWLMGLLVLTLTSEPLPAGIGLLTMVSGFELFFDVTSPGLAGVGMWAAVNLTMGLAISYLIAVGGATGRVL